MDSRDVPHIRQLDCGLVVSAPAQHAAAMRRLVHQLKYQASPSAARTLGLAIAAILPSEVAVVVPVPRAAVRRVRYGVDPAYELAQVVGRARGVPVQRMLVPTLWWPAHVGSSREDRKRSARFWSKGGGVVDGRFVALIDDVVTTGGTLSAAARCLVGSGAVDRRCLLGVAATLA